MALSKLCWYHEDFFGVPSDQKCEYSTSETVEGVPRCHYNCSTYSRCSKYFDDCGVPSSYWNNPDPYLQNKEDSASLAILKKIRSNVSDFVCQGKNIVMFSANSGNGKTTHAVNIIKSFIRAHSSGRYDCNLVRYIHIPAFCYRYDLYEKLSYDDSRRIQFFQSVDSLSSTKLVVFDEIGYNSGCRAEDIILRSIVSSRITNSYSNIFICNQELAELRKKFTDYEYNRIINSSVLIEFRGSDFRASSIKSWCD